MSAREIKPKLIRITDKTTGHVYHFRGFYKKDAENAVVSGRFESTFLSADEFLVDLQAGKVSNVIDLTAEEVATSQVKSEQPEEKTEEAPAE